MAIVGGLYLMLQTPSANAQLAAGEFIIAFDHIVQLEVLEPVNPALN
jgi:hypothetical protein